jgi:2-hydroxychromene-2-carboxylate isomerase
MRPTIAFHYDFVCPWAYLGFLGIEALAERHGAALELKPILLGGVFRAIGGVDRPAEAMPAAKLRYAERDLLRFAERAGVSLKRPADHPRRTVLALRAALASGDVRTASHALFTAYWKDGLDLASPEVVARALDEVGLDGAAAVREAESETIKRELRERTERAVAEGVFGVPTAIVEGPRGRSLHWGVDRFEQLEIALRPPRTVEFYFDYASPYAYLGATQIRRIAGAAGASLVLRPLLLGALFRSVGTPDVPLFAMPEPKQRYQGDELARWAEARGVPFRFSSRFPIRTVDALRLTLLAPDDRRADLVDALFRAAWVDDRDIADRSVLAAIAQGVGVGTELVARIDDDATKALLRAATSEAEARGVFGVPTCVVDGELYWGQDRLDWVERALAVR